MDKQKADMARVIKHVLYFHEWCDQPSAGNCKSCGHPKYGCEDSGKCDGCKMRRLAKRLVRWKEDQELG